MGRPEGGAHSPTQGQQVLVGLVDMSVLGLPVIQWIVTLFVLAEAVHSLGHSGHSLSLLARLLEDRSGLSEWLLLFLLVSFLPLMAPSARSSRPSVTAPLPLGAALANLFFGSLLLWVLALDGAWMPDEGPHQRVLWPLASGMLLGGAAGVCPMIRRLTWLAAIVPSVVFLANLIAPRPSHDFDVSAWVLWRLGPFAIFSLAGLALVVFIRIRHVGMPVALTTHGTLVLSLWGLCASTTMGALMPHHHLCVHLSNEPAAETARHVLIGATQLAFFAQILWRVRHRWRAPSPADIQASRSD